MGSQWILASKINFVKLSYTFSTFIFKLIVTQRHHLYLRFVCGKYCTCLIFCCCRGVSVCIAWIFCKMGLKTAKVHHRGRISAIWLVLVLDWLTIAILQTGEWMHLHVLLLRVLLVFLLDLNVLLFFVLLLQQKLTSILSESYLMPRLNRPYSEE